MTLGQERVNDFTNLAFHELTQVLQISIQMAKFTQPLVVHTFDNHSR